MNQKMKWCVLAASAIVSVTTAASAGFFDPPVASENPAARPGCVLQLRWSPDQAAAARVTYAPIFGMPIERCTRTEARAMANALAASLEAGVD